MADGGGFETRGNGGTTEQVGSSIRGSDDVIRIDPGVIDASATAATERSNTTRPGYGPNGRKLNRDGSERKQRTSKGGNASATGTAQATFSVEALAGTIVAQHAILSTLLKVPELSIDPREAQQLAAALANLQRFYPVVISEKALAWGNVISAIGMIYGTRVMAYGARKAAERKQNPQGATVIRPQQFQQRPQPQPQPRAQRPEIITPDGDPVAAATPQNSAPRPETAGDAAFQSIPPELI